MLDGIREIAAPHPPHILQRFLPLLPKYGDLTDQSNFYRLAQDVCELVTVNPVPWEGITIRADEVVAACRQQTLYELFRVIYESAARQTGASFWLCKSMKNMLYAEGIESTGISPYYIYLYRDGQISQLSRDHDLLQDWMPDILEKGSGSCSPFEGQDGGRSFLYAELRNTYCQSGKSDAAALRFPASSLF